MAFVDVAVRTFGPQAADDVAGIVESDAEQCGVVARAKRIQVEVQDDPITIEVRNPGSQTPLYTSTLVPAADGSFSVSTGLSGTYDIAVKGKTHLRKVLPNVVLEAEGISGLVWTLFNGDVNNDNIIDIADYTYLALAFDADQSNPAWSVPDSQGVALQDSDLNGDGIVDIADYTILATNFDGVGQP